MDATVQRNDFVQHVVEEKTDLLDVDRKINPVVSSVGFSDIFRSFLTNKSSRSAAIFTKRSKLTNDSPSKSNSKTTHRNCECKVKAASSLNIHNLPTVTVKLSSLKMSPGSYKYISPVNSLRHNSLHRNASYLDRFARLKNYRSNDVCSASVKTVCSLKNNASNEISVSAIPNSTTGDNSQDKATSRGRNDEICKYTALVNDEKLKCSPKVSCETLIKYNHALLKEQFKKSHQDQDVCILSIERKVDESCQLSNETKQNLPSKRVDQNVGASYVEDIVEQSSSVELGTETLAKCNQIPSESKQPNSWAGGKPDFEIPSLEQSCSSFKLNNRAPADDLVNPSTRPNGTKNGIVNKPVDPEISKIDNHILDRASSKKKEGLSFGRSKLATPSSSAGRFRLGERPRRTIIRKDLDRNTGLSWREEKELCRALKASLQSGRQKDCTDDASGPIQRHRTLIDGCHEEESRMSCLSQFSSDLITKNRELAELQYRAQRKFTATNRRNERKPSRSNVNCKKLVSKKAKTEDFLTFLCLRDLGKQVLPTHMDFYQSSLLSRRKTSEKPPENPGRVQTAFSSLEKPPEHPKRMPTVSSMEKPLEIPKWTLASSSSMEKPPKNPARMPTASSSIEKPPENPVWMPTAFSMEARQTGEQHILTNDVHKNGHPTVLPSLEDLSVDLVGSAVTDAETIITSDSEKSYSIYSANNVNLNKSANESFMTSVEDDISIETVSHNTSHRNSVFDTPVFRPSTRALRATRARKQLAIAQSTNCNEIEVQEIEDISLNIAVQTTVVCNDSVEDNSQSVTMLDEQTRIYIYTPPEFDARMEGNIMASLPDVGNVCGTRSCNVGSEENCKTSLVPPVENKDNSISVPDMKSKLNVVPYDENEQNGRIISENHRKIPLKKSLKRRSNSEVQHKSSEPKKSQNLFTDFDATTKKKSKTNLEEKIICKRKSKIKNGEMSKVLVTSDEIVTSPVKKMPGEKKEKCVPAKSENTGISPVRLSKSVSSFMATQKLDEKPVRNVSTPSKTKNSKISLNPTVTKSPVSNKAVSLISVKQKSDEKTVCKSSTPSKAKISPLKTKSPRLIESPLLGDHMSEKIQKRKLKNGEVRSITNCLQLDQSVAPISTNGLHISQSIPQDFAASSKNSSSKLSNAATHHPSIRPDAHHPCQLLDAPTYHPCSEQFEDPVSYFDLIHRNASPFGACRVVPPMGWKVDCSVPETLRFVTQMQFVHKLQHRWGPNVFELECIKKHLESQQMILDQMPMMNSVEIDLVALREAVKQSGGLQQVIDKNKWTKVMELMRLPKAEKDRPKRIYEIYCKYLLSYDTLSDEERCHIESEVLSRQQKTRYDTKMEGVVKGKYKSLKDFFLSAKNVMSVHFTKEPTPAEVETEYWRILTDRDKHVAVQNANVDTKFCGSGFPTEEDSPNSRHGWNFNMFKDNEGSILRHAGSISGVTIPSLHLAMLFSTRCWFRNKHFLPVVYYNHTGADVIWYSVPACQSEKLKQVVQKIVPGFSDLDGVTLPSRVMIHPSELLKHGVSVSRVVQRQGEYVFILPECFAASIATGYCIIESLHFGPVDWIPLGCRATQLLQDRHDEELFSMTKLLVTLVQIDDTTIEAHRAMRSYLQSVIKSELDLRDRAYNAGLRRSTAGHDEQVRCEVCKMFCYLSAVVNEQEDTVYCLAHALDRLNTKKKLSTYKLLFHLDNDELKMIQEKQEKLIAENVEPPAEDNFDSSFFMIPCRDACERNSSI